MAEFPSLPLFTDAWIADTAHLSRAERGLYMDIIILMWRSMKCRVPNDIEWIAKHLRCSGDERKALESVLEEFTSTDGNWRFQKRLRKEFNYVRERSKKQREKGKKRWPVPEAPKSSDPHNSLNPHDIDSSRGLAPNPNPNPNPIIKEESPSFMFPLEGETTKRKSEISSKGKARGTRLDPDFETKDADDRLGYSLGLTDPEVTFEFDKFYDYWTGLPGAKGTKLDWDATWRNWLRKAASDKQRSKANGQGKAQLNGSYGHQRR